MEEKYYEILRHYVNPNDCATVVKQLLSLHNVSQQRELLPDFLYKDDYGIKIGYQGDTEVSKEWNEYLEKLGNCG